MGLSDDNIRIRKYSLLIAKEREVRQKLEKAKQLISNLDQVLPESSPYRRVGCDDTDFLPLSSSLRALRESSSQIHSSRSDLKLKLSPDGDKFETAAKGIRRSSSCVEATTTVCKGLNRNRRSKCQSLVLCSSSTSNEFFELHFESDKPRARSIARKTNDRMEIAKKRALHRSQSIKSLDEDCKKAVLFLTKVRSATVSCSPNYDRSVHRETIAGNTMLSSSYSI